MKTRTLCIILILVLAILIIFGSGASRKPAYISKVYEIYGTWVNPDYNTNPGIAAIRVYHPNGEVNRYSENTATAAGSGEFVITNKWAGSKGTIWYTTIEKYPFTFDVYRILNIISNSGKTLEQTWTLSDYPTEIDTEHSRYAIYYRQ
jgi:hypothetical protein